MQDTENWVVTDDEGNYSIPYSDSLDVPGWYSPYTKIRYTGNGHYVQLNDTRAEALETINVMKSNNFIDFSTRAVFINANLYNANVDLVSVVRFNVEFIASGAIQTSSEVSFLSMQCET